MMRPILKSFDYCIPSELNSSGIQKSKTITYFPPTSPFDFFPALYFLRPTIWPGPTISSLFYSIIHAAIEFQSPPLLSLTLHDSTIKINPPLSLSLSSAHFLTLSHKNRIKLCTKSPSLGNLQSQQQWMAMPTNKNKQISKVQTLPQRYILYLYIVNNLQDSSQKNSFFFLFSKPSKKYRGFSTTFLSSPPPYCFFSTY